MQTTPVPVIQLRVAFGYTLSKGGISAVILRGQSGNKSERRKGLMVLPSQATSLICA
ncbi:MAG: hypothetical protein K2Y28_07720 [Burkholderiaceae bacterium]|nr:hypothetical protein [Burkholderiaceae bacterium]